jgi:hypothetical protein
MGKKPDPITDKAKSLAAEIAALEAEIKKLDTQIQRAPSSLSSPSSSSSPKIRSTATSQGVTFSSTATSRPVEKPAPPAPRPEPVFEEIKHNPLLPGGTKEPEDIYNDLGVRKYDLPALWNRIRNHMRGPTTTNPRLVNYLAAGGVQGLRPLRYEKRVARNRFIFFAAALFLLLLGIILVFVRHH